MAERFQAETEMSREEAAAYLHRFADELEKGGRVVVLAGDESRAVNPADSVLFRIDTATDTSWLGGDGGQSLSFELGWNREDVPREEDFVIVSAPGHREGDSPRRAREIREGRADDREEGDGTDRDTVASER